MMKKIAKTAYYSLDVDRTKNRAYLTIVGFWKDVTVVSHYIDDIKKACQDLSPGFTFLTDVSQMKTPPAEVGPVHEEVQRIVTKSGLKKTAEIVSRDHVIEQMVLQKWSTTSGMIKGTFHDKVQAEAWLDEEN
jgi:hypothetical protein